MRVLIVRNAFSYDFGGAEKLAVFLARELIENNHEAYVMTAHRKIAKFASLLGVPVLTGWWWLKQNWSGRSISLVPFYFLWQLVLFIRYCFSIIRFRPDVLHLMSKDDYIAATIAARLFRKRVVWTDCADLKFIYENIQAPFRNPVGKIVYGVSCRADAVTLVSQSEKQLIEENLGCEVPKNYRVIYMVGRDESTIPIDRDPDDIIFCATSRLVVAKGIGELIDAFSLISPTNPRYKLWIVGSGPDAELFKEQAKDNPAIRLWGHQDDPLQYLAAADIYVHPTHHEGFSLSLAEAAMLGKPMIATDVGGNPELVNENSGLLVPVKDVNTLAEAMVKLAEDAPRRQSMGLCARNDFLEKYDFTRIVKQEILPIYEKS